LSTADQEQAKVSRRRLLKWTGALAGAAVVGVGAGFGADMLIRPNAPTPPPQTSNGIVQVYVAAKGIQVTGTTSSPADATATSGISDANGWATVVLTTSTFPVRGTVSATLGGKSYTADYQVDSVSSPAVIYLIQQIAPVVKVLTSADTHGPMKVEVTDGVITRIMPYDVAIAPAYQLAYRRRVYSPDRIKYPMKRVGWSPGGQSSIANRGKGEFVRISWDEAINLLVQELNRIKSTYGPSALCGFNIAGWASAGNFHAKGTQAGRLFGPWGGYTYTVGNYSMAGWQWGAPYSYGTPYSKPYDRIDVLRNAKMMIMWSVNPAETTVVRLEGHGENQWLQRCKDAGIKMVVVDPVYTDTVQAWADEYIPIIPGTDVAMMAAMAYVIISENLHDQAYLDKYVVGFDDAHLPAGAPPKSSFKSYIMGDADGVPKTPEWAEAICGVPADRIRSLAREYATNKPCFLATGRAGAQRAIYGEQYVRMSIALHMITGQLGMAGAGPVPTDFSAGGYGGIGLPVLPDQKNFGSLPAAANPVKQFVLQMSDKGFANAILSDQPITFKHDRVTYTYPLQGNSPIHAIWWTGGSSLNQHCNINRTLQAFMSPKIELIVIQDSWWTPAAYFADLVLPVNTTFERNDIAQQGLIYIAMNKCIESLGESKSDWEIFGMLAEKLGLKDQFTGGKTEDQWLRELFSAAQLPMSYDDFAKQGLYVLPFDESKYVPPVTFKSFIDDPVKNPLNTPSKKFELYSDRLAALDDPEVPAVPKYIPSPEGRSSPLAAKYPLQLLTPHVKYRRHSTADNISWMRELDKVNDHEQLWINPIDAQPKGILNGDTVRVFNDRGAVLAAAKVTERVMPGVVRLGQGSWYKPVRPGMVGSLDSGGAVNVLCTERSTSQLAQGPTVNSNLVEVVKAEGM